MAAGKAEELNARHLAVLEKIVDKARREPEWKDKLMSDPRTAFKEAGMRTDELDPATADVVGQMRKAGGDQQDYLVYTLQTILISSTQ